jgi:DNA-binding NarL/FixJ family response regulator
MATTILIADDHAVMRDGLRFLLEAEKDFEVVGDTGDGNEVVDLVDQLHPDIVLMDIMMPGRSGIEAAQAVHECCPETRVLILSMHLTVEHIYRALRAGACGYLIKEAAGRQVIDAIRAVMDGQRYFSKRVVDLMTDAFLESYHPSSTVDHGDLLSAREREIMQMVIAGHSSREIAEALFLSPSTVDTYRARVMNKLGVHDISSLVRKGIELGITPSH